MPSGCWQCTKQGGSCFKSVLVEPAEGCAELQAGAKAADSVAAGNTSSKLPLRNKESKPSQAGV